MYPSPRAPVQTQKPLPSYWLGWRTLQPPSSTLSSKHNLRPLWRQWLSSIYSLGFIWVFIDCRNGSSLLWLHLTMTKRPGMPITPIWRPLRITWPCHILPELMRTLSFSSMEQPAWTSSGLSTKWLPFRMTRLSSRVELLTNTAWDSHRPQLYPSTMSYLWSIWQYWNLSARHQVLCSSLLYPRNITHYAFKPHVSRQSLTQCWWQTFQIASGLRYFVLGIRSE